MNLQPSEAEAGFDIRVPPTADPKSLETRISEEWAPQSRNMSFLVRTLSNYIIFCSIFSIYTLSLSLLNTHLNVRAVRGEGTCT